MFPFFNCYQIPQLNLKFKRLVVSPQRMTLLVKNILTIVEKNIFHTKKCQWMSLNRRIELPVREGNGNIFPCSVSKPELF